ncbi:hypothetical protein BH23ACT10_BH23ACT10_14660 [soil metagenome]
MKLAAHGLSAALPSGWEGTITAEQQDPDDPQVFSFGAMTEPPPTTPVAQFATFPLPAVRDDFGGAAVERMGRDDVFISLLEYGAEEVSAALFSDSGLPRRLNPRAFSPQMLQRRMPGHAGLQLFFNHNGRAFCLYIVLGDADDAHRLVRRAEQVLATIVIEDAT